VQHGVKVSSGLVFGATDDWVMQWVINGTKQIWQHLHCGLSSHLPHSGVGISQQAKQNVIDDVVLDAQRL
jgi:hypothetical protein